MAIFKSNPEKTIQRDIDAATANRDRLSANLAECDQAIARHATAAKESALSGDDAALDAAEASLRLAQDRATTLKTALTEMNQRLADLERAKEDAADKKLRAETAADIDRLIGRLTEVGTEFDNAASRLSEHTARAVPLVYDALGVDKFMAICRAEVPAALELVAKLLRAHADAVIAGTAPASLPRGDDQHVPAPAPAPQEPHFKYHAVKAEPTFKGFVRI
ncbi:thioesterase domain-containing protein [Bradyrhizobium sp. LB1.3]